MTDQTDQPVSTGSHDLGKTSSGMQPNFAALLSYVFGIISGLLFFLLEKENKFVRFHAMQSVCLFLGVIVVNIVLAVSVIGLVLLPLWYLIVLILWIICMVSAFQGKWFKIPVIGKIAAKQAGISA